MTNSTHSHLFFPLIFFITSCSGECSNVSFIFLFDRSLSRHWISSSKSIYAPTFGPLTSTRLISTATCHVFCVLFPLNEQEAQTQTLARRNPRQAGAGSMGIPPTQSEDYKPKGETQNAPVSRFALFMNLVLMAMPLSDGENN
jgi:hypothetical protein